MLKKDRKGFRTAQEGPSLFRGLVGLVFVITPWKINIAPENNWVVEENSLPIWSIFRFHVCLFPGVILSNPRPRST